MSAAGAHWGQRVAYATAGEQSRKAMERLLAIGPTASELKVVSYCITYVASYSKLNEVFLVEKIAQAVNVSRSFVGKILNKMHRLGVIGWASKTRGDSWFALDVHHLPVACSDSEESATDAGEAFGSTDSPSIGSNDDPTDREAFIEKNTKERETAPDSSRLYETTDDPSPDESLSPVETHDVDARFAASRLAVYLFNGLPDRFTMQRMYRRFAAAPIGSCTQVLEAALRGRPSRTVDCPHAYAVAWIATAERKVTHALAA